MTVQNQPVVLCIGEKFVVMLLFCVVMCII
jgi:hypothetical protein